jgi:hypothetical protein
MNRLGAVRTRLVLTAATHGTRAKLTAPNRFQSTFGPDQRSDSKIA